MSDAQCGCEIKMSKSQQKRICKQSDCFFRRVLEEQLTEANKEIERLTSPQSHMGFDKDEQISIYQDVAKNLRKDIDSLNVKLERAREGLEKISQQPTIEYAAAQGLKVVVRVADQTLSDIGETTSKP